MKPTDNSWTFTDTPLDRSLLWSLAITILPVVSSFVVSWVIARWAGPGIMGTVSWVMAYATSCLILGKFGIGVAVSRLASEYGIVKPGNLRSLLRTGIQLRLLFTLPVALVSLIFARPIAGFLGEAALTDPIRLGSMVILCASLYELKEHFLIGLNRLATVYRIRGFYLLSRVAFTVIVVRLGLGAVEILSGYCLAWLLSIVVYLLLLLKFLPAGSEEDEHRAVTRRLLRLSVPLAVSGASVAIYSQMDKLMLGYFCTMEEVGQYTIARNITEVSLFPAFAIIMALRPALASRYTTGALEECSEIIQKTLFISLLSGVLFTSLFAVLAEPLVIFVFSDGFQEAGSLMPLFTWVIVMRSLGVVILPALVAAEKTRVYAYLTLASASANFVLNIVLIPLYRSRGAVAATIASYGLLLILGLCLVIKTFKMRIAWSRLLLAVRVVLAGGVAGVLLRSIASHPSPQASVLLWSFVLAGFYAILLMVLRAVRPGDLTNLKNRFKEQ